MPSKKGGFGIAGRLVLANILIGFTVAAVMTIYIWLESVRIPSPEFFISALAAVLVMVAVNTIISVLMITGKTREISEKCDRISSGDLTVEFNSDDKSFGAISSALSKTVVGLREIVGKVNESTESIMNLAENLSASTQEINASSEEISSTVQQIARGVEQQAERTVDTSRIMEKMSTSIQEVAQKSEEVLAAATSARDATEKGIGTVGETMKKMDDIVEAT
ncbi:MAG TPA: methyl-accepting chemotaxis protein, partial [Candidatus Goldiibacteriota bacterium]|nr:methyl-accepting chemotaxis protein [Candidatus Goldiibacteriota bacterium]